MAETKPVPSNLVFALCFLAALTEGYDLQSAGLTAPKFAPLFHLDPAHLSWVFSANTFGLFLGAIIGGRLADSVGRRGVLIASMITFGVFSIATALVHDSNALIAMRFLTGLGLGGALPNIIALTAESGRPQDAAMRVTMLSAAMPFGGTIAGGLLVAMPNLDWSVIFWIGGAIPILVARVMMIALPESQSFQSHRAAGTRVKLWEALAGDGRLVTSILLWTSFFFTLLLLYLLLNWLPSLLVSKGFSKPEASMVSMAFTIGGGIGGVILGVVARMPMRWLLYVVTWLGMAAGMVWLALLGHDLLLGCTAGFIIGFFVIGGQFLLYGLSSHLYPSQMRGTGVGFAVGIGRLGSIAGPLFAGILLVAGRDAGTVMLAVVPMIFAALAAAVPLVIRRRQTLH